MTEGAEIQEEQVKTEQCNSDSWNALKGINSVVLYNWA